MMIITPPPPLFQVYLVSQQRRSPEIGSQVHVCQGQRRIISVDTVVDFFVVRRYEEEYPRVPLMTNGVPTYPLLVHPQRCITVT